MAYNDPWNSPVGFQLHPVQREPVCAALNSAILGKFDVLYLLHFKDCRVYEIYNRYDRRFMLTYLKKGLLQLARSYCPKMAVNWKSKKFYGDE